MAAAHRTLPFGTHVKVQKLGNGRAVVVRINDRGPFVRGRVIDVTKAAASQLGFIGNGIARVKLTVVDGQGRLSGNCT
jgi:rare lipoprotein A